MSLFKRGATTRGQSTNAHIIHVLTRARGLYGYTQERAAYESGKSQSWISQVERGRIDPPTSELAEYADIYDIEVRLWDRKSKSYV